MTQPDPELRNRINYLDTLPPAMWSADDALVHLEYSFDAALRQHPDVMERFCSRLEGVNLSERMSIMRYALASTVSERFK